MPYEVVIYANGHSTSHSVNGSFADVKTAAIQLLSETDGAESVFVLYRGQLLFDEEA